MLYVWFDKSAIQKSETIVSAQARIVKINTIIDTLLDAQLVFAADPNKQEYGLDDGQTKIKVTYRDLDAVAASIMQWEKVKSLYVNRVNGRVTRSLDSRNFPNWGVNLIP